MKTFVIAQHHGSFLTIQSLLDSGIDDIVVIIPGSQVSKYNQMYEENSHNEEFLAFKDYDKKIAGFIKNKDARIEAFVFEDFDVRNTVCSTLNFIREYGYNQIAACVLSGVIAIDDYREPARSAILTKEFGICPTRVYQGDRMLAMYHMIGLPQVDWSYDLNFFLVDMSKIKSTQLQMNNDKALFADVNKRKQLSLIDRKFNGKDDVLIGSAISARHTLIHNLNMQCGFIVNLWNKSIKPNNLLKSEELIGYPFNIYKTYAQKVGDMLPLSTVNKIVKNGSECESLTNGLYDCMDIIDL